MYPGHVVQTSLPETTDTDIPNLLVVIVLKIAVERGFQFVSSSPRQIGTLF